MDYQVCARRVLVLTILVAAFPSVVVHTAPATNASREKVRASYVRLPLRFEPGQDDGFVARGSGYAVSLSSTGASLLLKQSSATAPLRVAMTFTGSNTQARANARRELPGRSNHLIGNDPKRWRTGVRGFGEVEYRDIYRGIDVVYYGNQQQLEFDAIVRPGASTDTIGLAFGGATDVSINSDGDLVIAADGGRLTQHRPQMYQDDRGVRRTIAGGYAVRRDGTIGFRVGEYDHHLPLVIDPTVTFATYLGGINQERANAVAIDGAGNAIVVGSTTSPDFPTVNAVQAQLNLGDAFVTKLTPAGDAIVYSTYFGGTGGDEAVGVAVDSNGNACVTGNTDSYDFPSSVAIGSAGPRGRVFVAKFDPAGTLLFSTQIGGDNFENVYGIAVDAAGRAHIAGDTFSGDFPLVNPWQASLGGFPIFRTTDVGDAWTGVKGGLQVSGITSFAFDVSRPGTVYAGSYREGLFRTPDDGATWMQVAIPPQGIHAVAVASGALFAAGDQGLYRSTDHGDTWTNVMPFAVVTSVVVTEESTPAIYAGMGWTAGVLRSVDGGNTWTDTGLQLSAPLVALAASGSTVYAATNSSVFSVFTSTAGGPWSAATGSGDNALLGDPTTIAVDPTNPQVAYVGTDAGLFMTTSGGASWTPLVGFSFYVEALAIAPSDPSTVLFNSTLGSAISHDGGQTWLSSGLDANAQVYAFAFDPDDASHVYGGQLLTSDGFVATLSADGSRLEYSTYVGGSLSEVVRSIAVDGAGNRYIAGDTSSIDFPTVRPIQPVFGGLRDTFVTKIAPDGTPVYSTYLGGSQTEYNSVLAVDGAGRAYVTGLTLSSDFPVRNAWQSTLRGGYIDAFVTALNEDGSAFVYSTFLGGSGMELGSPAGPGPAIAVTAAGEAFVTGTTQSTDFPTTPDAWHRTYAGGLSDIFISHFDAAGTLRYSTYFGGQGADYGHAIAIDSTNAMVIVGYTDSTDWTLRSAAQPRFGGGEDAFVVKMSADAGPPDTIAPTTTIALAGIPGIPGWYKSPVTVTLSAVDDVQGRGVAFIEYSLNGDLFKRYTGSLSIPISGPNRITARATDWAGNVENPGPTATFSIDTTAPSVSIVASGTNGFNGWFKSPVTVSVVATDNGSFGTGVASVEYQVGDGAFQPFTVPFSITAAGTTQISARATDRNGFTRTTARAIAIDASAPHTTIAASGTPGLAGWYRSPVTITFSAVDDAAGSGVFTIDDSVNGAAFQRYTAPFTVATEGTTRIAARATDRAGNVETAAPATTVLIDVSAPIISVSVPSPAVFLHTDAPVLSFSAADAVSGVQTLTGSLEGTPVQSGQPMPLLSLALGAHVVSVTATDVAGNQATQSQPFTIVATVDSLITAVNLFANQGRIDSSPQKSLLSKLNDAKTALNRGNLSAASGDLKDFISQCAAQSGKGMAADVAAWLTTDATSVLGTI